jgi:hypothetical protein
VDKWQQRVEDIAEQVEIVLLVGAQGKQAPRSEREIAAGVVRTSLRQIEQESGIDLDELAEYGAGIGRMTRRAERRERRGR